MTSREAQSRPDVDNASYRSWTLIVGLAASLVSAAVEMASVSQSTTGSIPRLVVYLALAGTSAYQLHRERHTEVPLALAAVSFGLLSIFENGETIGLDSGTTLAVMILIGILFVTTRQGQSALPLVVMSGMIGLYTVALVAVERGPVPDTTGKLLLGIPGQMLVIWITWRLIRSLSDASEQQARQSRIQEALAKCSNALLTGRDSEPLRAALDALLAATDADYAYVDVNRVDPDGHVTWEIVADAYGENVPEGPATFDEGDYSQFPDVAEQLSQGRPAKLRISELPMPLRGVYEAEGIKSELMAPVAIRGQWVGTIGYIDFWRDNEWSDIELEALTRAAEMVAAFWDRESAREGLEELAKAKDRFIATVSHELRTPLAAVVGFAESLHEGLDTFTQEEVTEMVWLITSQGREVTQLVDDLLTAERAASGNLTIKPTSIDLSEETRAVVGSLRLDRVVEIEGVAAEAWADTLRTRQIVRNLLTNASRYGGDRVKVEVSNGGGNAILAVVDNGTGVRGLDAEHIFDPYYRSQGGTGGQDSVGLGLAVARQLARMMDGDLVYRRKDGWTRFELTLPTATVTVSPVP